jgi:hypothetical protein
MRMHYPSPPMACKVDGLHPHLAQQMADARNFTKSKVMVFHPRRVNPAACRRRTNAWTPGGIAIDQVRYKYLGVVQEDQDHAGAQRRCKDASSLWVLEATAVMQPADKGQTAHGSDLHPPRHVWREVWTRRRRSKTRCQRSKKALSILALHPRDCSSDVLYGDTGLSPGVTTCWQHRCQNMEAGRWPKEAPILIRG